MKPRGNSQGKECTLVASRPGGSGEGTLCGVPSGTFLTSSREEEMVLSPQVQEAQSPDPRTPEAEV